MKVAVNKCYGGFGLSAEAVLWLIKKNSPLIEKMTYLKYTGERKKSFLEEDEWQTESFKEVGDGFYAAGFMEHVLYDKSGENVWVDEARSYEKRSHPDLIELIETLKEAASGELAELEVVEIPDGVEYEIDDYDGIETIHEQHRSW